MRIGSPAFLLPALCLCALLPHPVRAENAVLAWNAAVLRALKRDASAPLLVRFSCKDGMQIGENVGRYVLERQITTR